MKSTENISLAGYSFTIETDAFNELDKYLTDIKSVFANTEGADEIVADIEERIAELLRERCIPGMTVNTNMIDDIRKRIGDPKELAQEDDIPQPEEKKNEDKPAKSWKSKRIYRNIDERILGGVCSGIGTYFGLDKVIFRMLFLIFFCVGLFGNEETLVAISAIGYICLWIAIPAARTVEQKREMKGKPMNLESYRTKDLEIKREMHEVAQSPAAQIFERAGGLFLGLMLIVLGVGGLLGSIFIPSIPQIMDNMMEWSNLDVEEQMLNNVFTGTTFWGLTLVMTGILCVWFLYNGVMLTFDLKSPSWRPGLVLFIAWIISVLVLAAWTIREIAIFLPTII